MSLERIRAIQDLIKRMGQAATQHFETHKKSTNSSFNGVSLFLDLTDQEVSCFRQDAQTLSYKKGRILYLQGELARKFYVIVSGWIKLFHTMPEGDEVIVDMLTTNNIVGESAIFDHGCYTSSAQIVEDVQVLSISLQVLKSQIHINPKLAFNMLTSMSQHHRRHYGVLALNAMQTAPQRIGCFLLSLCPLDQKRDIVFHLPYDKTLVAEILGMKGATFSRSLNILRQKTGISIKGTRIEVSSTEKLSKYVYGPAISKPTATNK
jgi:CRP/FNR family transcriptional regulator, dissimilatory nitrate respiration regulator